MLNLDSTVYNKNTSSSEDNNWSFRMLVIGPSGFGKTNTLLHLINNLHPIDKIHLYAKDIHEPKYEYLINKREQARIKNLNDPHAFIEYSNDMNDVLDDINDYCILMNLIYIRTCNFHAIIHYEFYLISLKNDKLAYLLSY